VEYAKHADDLSAMERGMGQHMPQNLPAGKVRLNFVSKPDGEFDAQAALWQIFEPAAEAFPDFRPALLDVVERVLRCRTLRQLPGTQVCGRSQTMEPNSFAIVDMAESGKNATM